MKELIAFIVFVLIWIVFGKLQDNVFMIKTDEWLMTYGAVASMTGFFVADLIKS